MRKWGFIDNSYGRKKIVVRRDLADEVIGFLQEAGGGRLKLGKESYVPMIAARFAQYPDHESSALGKKHQAGRVLLAQLRPETDSAVKTACYVVAPESAYALSAAEESILRQRAAKELRDTNSPDQNRAEAALFGMVVILAAIYFFW
jgi:hypothetical protein